MFEVPKKKTAAQAQGKEKSSSGSGISLPKSALGILNRPAANPAPDSPGNPSQAEANRTPAGDRAHEVVSIGNAATIRGDITGKGNLMISGRVEGTVDLPENDANVEKPGFMDGSILARNVNIRGSVQGDIEARRKVTIFATGKVAGTIISPRIEIEDGAKFKGRIDMGSTAKPAAAKPKAAPARAHAPAPAQTATPAAAK